MLKYRAYAKLNLTLDILGRYDNGYHRMDMLMQSVSLHDTLYLNLSPHLSLHVERGSAPEGEDNLVLRAAAALQRETGVRSGAEIRLVKRIPMQSGLGGGSADAAAALIGLNRLWDLGLSHEKLLRLGAGLGADVPFCIQGGTARATGIGTELTSVRRTFPLHFVLCRPEGGLSTPQVFSMYDDIGSAPAACTAQALAALADADPVRFSQTLSNSLEKPACALLPAVGEAMETMRSMRPLCVRMTGSGSAIFGLFRTQEDARRAADRLWDKYGYVAYACAVPAGVELCGDEKI